MKKIFTIILLFILIITNKNVLAQDIKGDKANIDISIQGKVEEGQNIQILINIHNVKNLYAGAVKLKYDKDILKVTGFQKGSFITRDNVNVFEADSFIDQERGIANFKGFSCLGEVPGFSGSGTVFIINACVLKSADFHLKSVPLLKSVNDDDNLKIQIIDNNLKDIDYDFTPYTYKAGSKDVKNSNESVSYDKKHIDNSATSVNSKNSNSDIKNNNDSVSSNYGENISYKTSINNSSAVNKSEVVPNSYNTIKSTNNVDNNINENYVNYVNINTSKVQNYDSKDKGIALRSNASTNEKNLMKKIYVISGIFVILIFLYLYKAHSNK